MVLGYLIHKGLYNGTNNYSRLMDWYMPKVGSLIGWTQMKNTQASTQAQMDYEAYLRQGYERQLADWHKNVPGREIRYPELSYPGYIYRSNTASARAGYDYDTAGANYYGNLPYRALGLYGIGSRVSRWI